MIAAIAASTHSSKVKGEHPPSDWMGFAIINETLIDLARIRREKSDIKSIVEEERNQSLQSNLF